MRNIRRSPAVLAALGRARYEVLPTARMEAAVAVHVPTDVRLTITASPAKGLAATLECAERLLGQGYRVTPHLAARMVRDRAHLADLVQQLAAIGVDNVFVPAGDADPAAGSYHGSLDLLRDLSTLGHCFTDVGITGYPESHPFISDETTIQAMFEKARFATYIVSQICFDPAVTASWVERVWDRGTRLPIWIGIPGAVPRAKLLRISTTIGLGASARFLNRHRGWVRNAIRPGGFSPDPLIAGLEESFADPDRKIAGFHIFTFNDLADTESWRQRHLAVAAPAS